MRYQLSTPTPDQLGAVVEDLASWQQDGLPVQLHPGDLGWHWRFGAGKLAEALRVWTVAGTSVAIGFLDKASLIRMAIAPTADQDAELAQALVSDLEDPSRGILDANQLTVEARFGTAFRSRLRSHGWVAGEPWTPLVRDLDDPVEDSALRVAVVGQGRVDDRVAVQRAAFPRSTFSADNWRDMSLAPAYARACCLVGYDGQDNAVATVTVWSAGSDRPGLLEPMGVHHDHRGRGHGTAICLAGAATLRSLGASRALVATPTANEGAVATYAAAGFHRLPDVTDFDWSR